MTTQDNKTWSGRFSEPVDELVKRYTASVEFDKRLAPFDIQASLAHATMLEACGIIATQDLTDIRRGLMQIKQEIFEGKFSWLLDLEDVHLNIENRLTALVGDAGKRLHTGRSRNDQVATDVRLYLRHAIDELQEGIRDLQYSILDLAARHIRTIMPGYTHLQVAQPVSFAHHLMAYFEMLKRDAERIADCRKRVNRLPLGAAALAGTSYPIKREMVAELLGFDGVSENSLDAVSDRDFIIEFTACAALIMTHLSRFSEELILWMNPRLGFIDIADRFCTGSSIMPQKKNPDVPELVRGKTGRVNGNLVSLLTLMKSQPLAYNKDNQEDKEPLFDSVDTLTQTLRIFSDMVRGITVKPDAMRSAAMQGYATATDLADYLVKKGLPFRDAHEAVALAVRFAEQNSCDLSELTLEKLKEFSPLVADDVYSVLTLEGSLASRDHIGGTAPRQVEAAITKARKDLEG
uniref:Argininosuccinate lyase n=1 Tax=Candidatus Nitrotoga fabula TaxID=2182327 RepID=A0A2X0QRQ0_9PROT|nr:argininosuccinate lyase (Arginosuccinase) (ASAL) [Candidatus Nitrotoga fabula]